MEPITNDIIERQRRFMALLTPVYPNLERFVRSLTRRYTVDDETAKDILAETIVVAFERFEQLRHPEAFLSFLFTIASRLQQKHHKHMAVLTSYDAADEEFEQYEKYGIASAPADASADVSVLYAALDRLPDKQREAVIMFEILGYSMKEIQVVQGGTLVAVKVRISRGRKALAVMLGEDNHGE